MHYYKSNNEIMQYCIVSNDIALIMHYCALLKRSAYDTIHMVSKHQMTPFNNLYIFQILKKIDNFYKDKDK